MQASNERAVDHGAETYANIADHVLRELGVRGNEEFGDPMRAEEPTPREIGEVYNPSMVAGLHLAGVDTMKARWAIGESVRAAYSEGGISHDRIRQIVDSYESRDREYGA